VATFERTLAHTSKHWWPFEQLCEVDINDEIKADRVLCFDRSHKHNADNVRQSGGGERGDGQPVLDEPDVSAAGADACE